MLKVGMQAAGAVPFDGLHVIAFHYERLRTEP